MKEFKYSILKLIECVKSHPCLWNKKLEVYKDKLERRTAWDEICFTMDERFGDMSAEDRHNIEEQLMTKWANVRDTFVKTLKKKNGKKKKRYVYHPQLEFMLPVLIESDIVPASYFEDDYSEETPSKNIKQDTDYEPPRKTCNRNNYEETRRSDSEQDPFESKTYPEINSDVRVMNEDEAFFASLLPTVVQYNEDERLEFRIQVLDLMKKIREKHKDAYKVVMFRE